MPIRTAITVNLKTFYHRNLLTPLLWPEFRKIIVLLIVSFLTACATVDGPEMPGEETWNVPTTRASDLTDTDQDGLSDEREKLLGTLVESVDSDNDGLSDGFEDRHGVFGFDPLRPTADTDRDGLPDSLELELGSSPNSPDSDGDRLGDFDEYLNRLFGYDLIRETLDDDFDGLSNDFEITLGSSPVRVDSNDDGVSDFASNLAGFHPVNTILKPDDAELVGVTYSNEVAQAIEDIRAGSGSSASSVAEALPYPAVTTQFVQAGTLNPSAALLQLSVHNPTNSPQFYRPYTEIVTDLLNLADYYDGSPGPDIVRLFVWSAPTVDCCNGRSEDKSGENIYLVKISDNPHENENEPEVAIMGMHHGRELISASIATNIIEQLTSRFEAGDREVQEILGEREIWILPIVNPNGYERARGLQLNWRKNTRRVSDTQFELKLGVDNNRNYSVGHATLLSSAERASLPDTDRSANGITLSGGFDENSDSYPHTQPFSEVETQAVRGLGLSLFNTSLGREEIDGFGCSISWHSFTGLIGHPMGHDPIAPTTDLSAMDRTNLDALTSTFASVTGYVNHKDQWRHTMYSVFGGSEEWFYRDQNTLSTFVEAYSVDEGRSGDSFYPETAAEAEMVMENNYQGALAFIRECVY